MELFFFFFGQFYDQDELQLFLREKKKKETNMLMWRGNFRWSLRGLLRARNLDNWLSLADAYPARVIANVINTITVLNHWTRCYAPICLSLASALAANEVLNSRWKTVQFDSNFLERGKQTNYDYDVFCTVP